MRERWTTLAGGLLSAVIVAALMLPPQAPRERPASVPTSVDRGAQGLAGLAGWLEASDVAWHSLRRRYDGLRALAPGQGNLLITSTPHPFAPAAAELEDLASWVKGGNSLLVLVAAAHRPEWARRLRTRDRHRVLEGLGLRLEPAAPAEDAPPAGDTGTGGSAAEELRLTPTLPHPILAGAGSLAVRRDSGSGPWALAAPAREAVGLALLQAPGGAPALWEVPMGRGRAWVSAHPGPFGNATLGAAGNARLIANLMARALGPGGRVIFDDFHFGLSAIYDPRAFFSDPRLHLTLAFLGGLWVLYLVGHSNRLAPPRRRPRPRRAADFVEALAGLAARRVGRAGVARALERHFFNEVRARHRLPRDGRPAWSLLAADAAVPRGAVEALRTQLALAHRGRKPDLARIARLMNRTLEAMR